VGGVALRREPTFDAHGVGHDPPVRPERRAVAWVNRLALVATAYDPLWRGRATGLLTLGRYRGSRELDQMTAWASLQPDDAVLDIGCGSGHYLRALHAAQPRARLHGCDLSAAFLRVGARRLARDGIETSLLQADAHDLPYADGSFAAVTIGGTPNELRDRPAAFAEAARVLRPGGRLWLMASTRGAGPIAGTWARLLARSGLALSRPDTLVDEVLAAGFEAGRIEHRPPLLLGRFVRTERRPVPRPRDDEGQDSSRM
jgi:2-polyprenyl-6-hydroxyphenyl methylase/3-demethylubiquinone-9 3-methyltransferase